MSDSIAIWDSIFAFHYQNRHQNHKLLEMIDYLCLGMLQFVRHDCKYNVISSINSTIFKY